MKTISDNLASYLISIKHSLPWEIKREIESWDTECYIETDNSIWIPCQDLNLRECNTEKKQESLVDINKSEEYESKLSLHLNAITELYDQKRTSYDKIKSYALYPINDSEMYIFYITQELMKWTATEFEFLKDRDDYERCTPPMKRMMDLCLGYFLIGDGIISHTVIRYILECKTFEEMSSFIVQLGMELQHAESYGLAATTFKRGTEEMTMLIEQLQSSRATVLKTQFATKWLGADRPRWKRLIASACTEGIQFCSLFAIIFWFKSKKLFSNFSDVNEMIARDESIHRDQNISLALREMREHNISLEEATPIIEEIVYDALSIEIIATEDMIPEPIDDLNKEDMSNYVRLITDNLFVKIGLPTHFNVKNPFTWLDNMVLEQKGNFYEVKIGAYMKGKPQDYLDWKTRAGITSKINPYDAVHIEDDFGDID